MTKQRAAFKHILIGQIRPGRNVRVDLNGIEDLADSLRLHGMLQPITVVPTEEGDEVEVLFGHRRLAAAKLAKFGQVPCFMRVRGDERTRLLTQLAENFDRAQMTPLDEALAFRDLKATGMNQLAIASMVHRSDFYVSVRFTLLKYPECVQRAVHEERISLGTALLIPLEFLVEEKAVESLAKVLQASAFGNATPVKTWVEQRYKRVGRTPQIHQRRRRYIEVSLECYARADQAARKERLTVAEWAQQLIESATQEAGR